MTMEEYIANRKAAKRLNPSPDKLMFSQICNRVQNGRIVNPYPEDMVCTVDPTYRSRVIESILCGIPFHQVMCLEQNDGVWVLETHQTDIAIVMAFIHDKFELSGLRVWTEYEGKKFSDFMPLHQVYVEECEVRCHAIRTYYSDALIQMAKVMLGG